MDQDIISTKRFFESHYINLSEYWLQSCIEWYREENPNSNYNLETLHLKVYEQWLLLDLRDVEVPILPPNLAQQKKFLLNGTFSLQLLFIVDISRPKLWQIQKLRNSGALSNASAGEQDFQTNLGKRMLQLQLTDGVSEIEAIEYQPIRGLNINLAPGIKIKIIGPVMVRRGQMLLEEKHVSIIGGEVEELLVQNAAENVLARALNLPINPNPRIMEESLATANTSLLQNTNRVNVTLSSFQASNDTNVVASKIQQKPPSSVDVQKRTQPSTSANFISEEEEMRIKDEIDMLLEAERDIMMEESKPVKTNHFEDLAVNPDAVLKLENTEDASIKKNVSSGSIFEDMDIDAHLDLIDKQLESDQGNLKGVVTIKNLLKNRNNITSGRFTIKAKFKSILQKITITNDAWTLKLLITDQTGDLEAHVHTDIISNLTGYFPSAVMAVKREILNKDKCAADKVMKSLEELKEKIMELDGLMEVLFTHDEDCPTIVNLK